LACQRAQAKWPSPLIVAGSVVAAEEPHALIAFGTLQGEYPKALLVLAPRKPECFDAAAEYIDESHRKFIRRSKLPIPGPASQQPEESSKSPTISDDVTVLLLDSIGELASLYALADGALLEVLWFPPEATIFLNLRRSERFQSLVLPWKTSLRSLRDLFPRVLPFKWKARKTLACLDRTFSRSRADEKNE